MGIFDAFRKKGTQERVPRNFVDNAPLVLTDVYTSPLRTQQGAAKNADVRRQGKGRGGSDAVH